ncbi:TPA: hypothetical protein JZ977_001696 [Escherichia coli]|nr:hypothetical protein [Escherichia coli]HAY4448691.1 hypothetical protein [Escherichia coli]HAY4491701.1 hypothetical protein [Escherichia coli]HAY4659648.1 hypothetical protein [Escherichia coli]
MTITKQRVEEIISRIEMYGHGAGYTVDEVYDLAVLALNLSNIANLKRYELDMDGCDSFGQDCGADMTEDPDGDYVLFDDVVKLFEFDTTTKKLETPATDAFLAEVLAQCLNAFIQHHSAELDAHIKNGGEQFDEKSVRIRDIIVSARLFREQIRKGVQS